jgi:hypothetical protein
VREMSIGENYERKYNPHPLKYFEIFARHRRQAPNVSF